MPDEFDAFGRKREDGGLGWDTTPSPTPPPTPPPTPSPAVRPRRNPVVIVVQVAVLAGIVVAIVLAVSAGHSAQKSVRTSLDGLKTQTQTQAPSDTDAKADAKVPKQVRTVSFFTPKGLRAGLKILASEQPGKLSSFSMRADRIDVQVVRGGKTHTVELKAGAEVPEEYSASSATGAITKLSYEELNAGAPQRLLRAAGARLHSAPSKADYFVADRFDGPLIWILFYKNGHAAKGDSRGRYVSRLQ